MGRCGAHWGMSYKSVHQAEIGMLSCSYQGDTERFRRGGGKGRGRGTDREMWGRGQPGSLCGMRGQGKGRGQAAVSTVTGVRGGRVLAAPTGRVQRQGYSLKSYMCLCSPKEHFSHGGDNDII